MNEGIFLQSLATFHEGRDGSLCFCTDVFGRTNNVYVAERISTFGFGSFGEDRINIFFGAGSVTVGPIK